MIKTGMAIGAGCTIEFASNLFFMPSSSRSDVLIEKSETKLKELFKKNNDSLKYGVNLGRLSFLIVSGCLNRNLPFLTQNLPFVLALTEPFRQQTINNIEQTTNNLLSHANHLFRHSKQEQNQYQLLYSSGYENLKTYSWSQALVAIFGSMALSVLVDQLNHQAEKLSQEEKIAYALSINKQPLKKDTFPRH